MENLQIKIILNRIIGGIILGALFTPIVGVMGQWFINQIDPVTIFPLSISFLIAASIGGLIGYFLGKITYKKYQQHPMPEFTEQLPQINWKWQEFRCCFAS